MDENALLAVDGKAEQACVCTHYKVPATIVPMGHAARASPRWEFSSRRNWSDFVHVEERGGCC